MDDEPVAPDGWATARLGDLCSLITDGTHHSPPNGPRGDFPYVTAKNIRPWGLDLSDITYVSADVHRAIFQRCPVQKHDVLYIKDGATTGLAVINPLDLPFSVLSSVAVLRPKGDLLDPRFLAAWLNSPETLDRMTGAMSGSAIRRLVLRTIRETQITFPPLDEQRHIVTKVEALLARVNAARDCLARVPAILKRFRQSVLAAAVLGVPTESLGSLIGDLRYGTAAKCKPEAMGTPVLRIPNVVKGRIDVSDLKYAPLSSADRKKLALEPGDLLLVRSNGSVSLVGRGALATPEVKGFAFAGYLLRLRVDPGRIAAAYLSLCLELQEVRDQIELPLRSTSGVHNINAGEVRALRIPLPSLAEQSEIVRRVETLFALADTIEQRAATALHRADRLTQFILSKAFRGDLMSSPQP